MRWMFAAWCFAFIGLSTPLWGGIGYRQPEQAPQPDPNPPRCISAPLRYDDARSMYYFSLSRAHKTDTTCEQSARHVSIENQQGLYRLPEDAGRSPVCVVIKPPKSLDSLDKALGGAIISSALGIAFHAPRLFGVSILGLSVGTGIRYFGNLSGYAGHEDVEKLMKRGFDRRVHQRNAHEWPWCVHGRMTMSLKGDIYCGTGTLVGDRYVVTAAHNLYDVRNKCLVDDINFYPGQSGKNVPWHPKVVGFAVHPDYMKEHNDRREESDIGILILQEPMGDRLGSFGLKITPDNLSEVTVTGYPGRKEEKLYSMKGPVIGMTSSRVFYDIDTTPGQSGSGVWIQEAEDYSCVSVHTLDISQRRRAWKQV